LWLLVASFPLFSVADDVATAHPSAVELQLITSKIPWRIDIDIDGLPVDMHWGKAFEALHRHYDRDHNESLSLEEAMRLPSASAWKQMLWGQCMPSISRPLPFDELDRNRDGGVTLDELKHWYEQRGLGEVVVSHVIPAGLAEFDNRLTTLLDGNRDGVLDEEEFLHAEQRLMELDRNEDWLVEMRELSDRLHEQVVSSARQLSSLKETGNTGKSDDKQPIVRTKRRNPIKPAPDEAEIASIDHVRWVCGFSSVEGVPHPELALPLKPLSAPNLRVSGVRWQGAAPGAIDRFMRLARERFTALDMNHDQVVDEEEAKVPHAFDMVALVAVADDDGDHRLSESELDRWLMLQQNLARPMMQVKVIESGSSLFQLLDANADQALSQRELRMAWSGLQAEGCVVEGKVDVSRIPHQWTLVMSPGRAEDGRIDLPNIPAWFQAMDRNGDGDLSLHEFTGPLDKFQKLDTDLDGLLTSDEAVTPGADR
jgi:Ca2+-binding EF-hand superfamily protein